LFAVKEGSLLVRARRVLYDCFMHDAQPHRPRLGAFRPGALAGVTQMNAHFTEHSFERHSHETYSIGVTASGVQTFHCGGTLHASLRGDVILFNPDEPHDGQRGTQEGFGYSMLYVAPQVVDECRDKEAGLDMAAYFRQPVVRDAAMGRALAQRHRRGRAGAGVAARRGTHARCAGALAAALW
jgi:hypothetical protein